MDPNMIVPFIKSTKNIFEMMLQLDVNVGEPSIKQSNQPSHAVSGIIAFSGDLNGSVVLSFPWDTAQRVVTLFTGMEIGADQREELADAVAEAALELDKEEGTLGVLVPHSRLDAVRAAVTARLPADPGREAI